MAEEQLNAEIILAEFVPPEARCPAVYQAVDSALAAGDVKQLAVIIRATQLQQQQQLDTHSRQISEIRQALSELQKTPPAVCNLYLDNRQWDNRQWHHTDSSRTSTDNSRTSWSSTSTTEDNSQTGTGVFDLLVWWAVALALMSVLTALHPEGRQSVPSGHETHMRGGRP